MGAEHRGPGGDAEEKASQDKLVLVGKGDRRHGGLAHIVEHQYIGGIYHVCYQVLDRDRDDQREQGLVKKPLFQHRCFICTHNADSIAESACFVKNNIIFRCQGESDGPVAKNW